MRPSLLGPRLRIPTLLLANALILGIALLFAGLSIHSASEAELARETVLESAAARAARDAPEKMRQSQSEAGRYAELRRGGFLGAERRAGWITALGQARADLKLDSLSWRLAPRAASPLAPGLRFSVMDISASTVDSSGLASLLDFLRKRAPGYFTVERCALVLNPDGMAGQAECRLNWWTWEDEAPRR